MHVCVANRHAGKSYVPGPTKDECLTRDFYGSCDLHVENHTCT